jgi:hypothetical protein
MTDATLVEALVRAGFDRQTAERLAATSGAETRLELEIVAALHPVLYPRPGVGRKTLLWLARLVRVALEGRP